MPRPALTPWSLSLLLLAACGDVRPDVRSLASSGGDGGGSQVSHPQLDGGAADAGMPDAPPDPPPPESCPTTIPAPVDCGDYALECGGAVPIAAGGNITFAGGVAVDATYVYWVAHGTDLSTCGDAIYRTPRTPGAPSTLFAQVSTLYSFEADDSAVYYLGDHGAVTALLPSDGSAVPLGAVPPPPAEASGEYVIARTNGGMVVFLGDGPWQPSFYGVDLAGITELATIMDDGDLASVPAFDGTSLFFAWEPTSNPEATPLRRAGAGAPGFTDIAPSTTSRMELTVAVDGDEVFFVTGDPEVAYGVIKHPMGILAMNKSGGAVTTLVPPGSSDIERILLDANDVYFLSSSLTDPSTGYVIQAVPRAGGVRRTVWSGPQHPDSLHLAGDQLYFALDVRKYGGEIQGPGGLIVAVPTHPAPTG